MPSDTPGSGTIPTDAGAATSRRVPTSLRGTIPARAGSSRPVRARSPPSWDHPARAGSRIGGGPSRMMASGPFPRGRGAAQHELDRALRGGTIPARAGSSAGSSTQSMAGRDHPARAGSRRRQPRGDRRQRDHPRASGEQARTELVYEGLEGPSPRGRGAVEEDRQRVIGGGAIPARAGSSLVDLQCYAPEIQEFATFRDSDISDMASPSFLWLGWVFEMWVELGAL